MVKLLTRHRCEMARDITEFLFNDAKDTAQHIREGAQAIALSSQKTKGRR